MQEEVTQKTIALVIKTAKLDANVLKAAMRMYLNHRRQKAQKTHGKTSVKKLVGEGVGVASIEVTDGNIKSFERVARKYNVDFEYSCAMKSHFRKSGNQMSGKWKSSYASLLA